MRWPGAAPEVLLFYSKCSIEMASIMQIYEIEQLNYFNYQVSV